MFAHAWSFNSDISKWNTSCVTDMSSMFYSAFSFNSEINTTSVQVDGIKYVAWDVKNVTDMSRMFQNNAQALNVSGWKVCNLSEFNQDISNWNTSKVTSMTYMFGGAAKFDSEINTKLVTVDESDYVAWDVANVEDMRRMFGHAQSFNHPLDKWNTSKVTDAFGIFWDAYTFNQDIDHKLVTVNETEYYAWDVSKVSDFWGLFYNAEKFNGKIFK